MCKSFCIKDGELMNTFTVEFDTSQSTLRLE